LGEVGLFVPSAAGDERETAEQRPKKKDAERDHDRTTSC
jgi:hypothetical protein